MSCNSYLSNGKLIVITALNIGASLCLILTLLIEAKQYWTIIVSTTLVAVISSVFLLMHTLLKAEAGVLQKDSTSNEFDPAPQAEPEDNRESHQQMQRFVTGIFNVWAQQLDTVKVQLKSQISHLSGTFSRLSEKMYNDRQQTEKITEAFVSDGSKDNQGAEVTAEFCKKLDATLKVLHNIMALQEKIPSQINELVPLTKTIKTMAEDVRRISEQTNLIALNAAIEAARAGDAGRGFAIVADEIRELANAAASTADRIMESTKQANNIVKHTADTIIEEVEVNRVAVAEASETLKAVEERFSEILASIFKLTAFLQETNKFIDQEIAEALPYFQFEDRFFQILDNMEHGLPVIGGRISDLLQEPEQQINVNLVMDWVAQIRQQYTTSEERRVIDAEFGRSDDNPEADGGEVIFL